MFLTCNCSMHINIRIGRVGNFDKIWLIVVVVKVTTYKDRILFSDNLMCHFVGTQASIGCNQGICFWFCLCKPLNFIEGWLSLSICIFIYFLKYIHLVMVYCTFKGDISVFFLKKKKNDLLCPTFGSFPCLSWLLSIL